MFWKEDIYTAFEYVFDGAACFRVGIRQAWSLSVGNR